MTASAVTMGSIVATWRAVLARDWLLLVAAGTVQGLVSAVPTALTGKDMPSIVESMVNIVLTYFVLREMLRRDGVSDCAGNFAPYLRTSLLSALGIVIGFILLIVPGLVLLARWSLGPPLAMVRDIRATDALQESWNITRGCFWPLLGTYAVFGTALFGAVIGIGYVAAGSAPTYISGWVVPIVTSIMMMSLVALTAAIYRLLVSHAREFDEVFA
jgi:hypothetical protein